MQLQANAPLVAANFDAFGRQRVSMPETLFSSTNRYGKSPLLFNESLTGSAASNWVTNENAVKLTVSATSGDIAIRQTKSYFRYQPGKSQLIYMTAVMGGIKANVRQRVGMYDGYDGLFFEQTSAGLSVVRRTYVSGSASDNPVLQSAWNLDKCDGTGPSKVSIDTTKSQIFTVDLEYLGVGSVRFGFVVDGKVIYCHQMRHANNLTTVYMSNSNLPLRYEIATTNTAASPTDMYCICCSVMSEGGETTHRGYPFARGNLVTVNTSATLAPVLSIRPKNVFGGKTNRAHIILQNIEVMAGGAAVVWYLVYNGTSLTNVSWVSQSANSVAEYDISATAITITTAEIIASGCCASGATSVRGVASRSLDFRNPLTLSIDGFTADTLSLCVATPTGTGTVQCALSWIEQY